MCCTQIGVLDVRNAFSCVSPQYAGLLLLSAGVLESHGAKRKTLLRILRYAIVAVAVDVIGVVLLLLNECSTPTSLERRAHTNFNVIGISRKIPLLFSASIVLHKRADPQMHGVEAC